MQLLQMFFFNFVAHQFDAPSACIIIVCTGHTRTHTLHAREMDKNSSSSLNRFAALFKVVFVAVVVIIIVLYTMFVRTQAMQWAARGKQYEGKSANYRMIMYYLSVASLAHTPDTHTQNRRTRNKWLISIWLYFILYLVYYYYYCYCCASCTSWHTWMRSLPIIDIKLNLFICWVHKRNIMIPENKENGNNKMKIGVRAYVRACVCAVQ